MNSPNEGCHAEPPEHRQRHEPVPWRHGDSPSAVTRESVSAAASATSIRHILDCRLPISADGHTASLRAVAVGRFSQRSKAVGISR